MHEQTNGLDLRSPHRPAALVCSRSGRDPNEFGLRVARQLEEKIDELGEDNVAAFIAEPVQGAGGVIIPPILLAENSAHL